MNYFLTYFFTTFLLGLLALPGEGLFFSHLSTSGKLTKSIPVFTYEIVKVYPHDPGAFTQGLVFADGFLYEGTGLRGRSSLRKVDLATGHILKLRKLPVELFGEEVTIMRRST